MKSQKKKQRKRAREAIEKLDEAEWRRHQEAMRLEHEREKQGHRIYEV